MRRKATALLLFLAMGGLWACASHGPKRRDAGLGLRVLDCVVVDRDHEAPGSGGSSYAGTGNYFLVFETHEGNATARYRFQVNRTQWFRFPEGSRVRVTLNNDIVTDIRSNE